MPATRAMKVRDTKRNILRFQCMPTSTQSHCRNHLRRIVNCIEATVRAREASKQCLSRHPTSLVELSLLHAHASSKRVQRAQARRPREEYPCLCWLKVDVVRRGFWRQVPGAYCPQAAVRRPRRTTVPPKRHLPTYCATDERKSAAARPLPLQEIRFQSRRLARHDGPGFPRAGWIKRALLSAVSGLERVAPEAIRPPLEPWTDAARNASEAIDAGSPFGFGRATMQDAFRTVADAFMVAAQVAATCE
jgi:hypothetical protein